LEQSEAVTKKQQHSNNIATTSTHVVAFRHPRQGERYPDPPVAMHGHCPREHGHARYACTLASSLSLLGVKVATVAVKGRLFIVSWCVAVLCVVRCLEDLRCRSSLLINTIVYNRNNGDLCPGKMPSKK